MTFTEAKLVPLSRLRDWLLNLRKLKKKNESLRIYNLGKHSIAIDQKSKTVDYPMCHRFCQKSRGVTYVTRLASRPLRVTSGAPS